MKLFLPRLLCVLAVLVLASPAIALDVPDKQLQSKSKVEDADLVTTQNQATDKQTSQLDLFINTLLGKNIDKPPEKSQED